MITNEHIASEAFIRRATRLNMPFMLKGSFISRQYFPAGVDRYPADLDWVYLEPISSELETTAQMDAWMIAITEMDLDDGIRFRSFTENRFWRMIEYAMADDFPTINTDILCWVGEEELTLHVDVTFNLAVDQAPVSLQYKPQVGKTFEIPLTVPLSLQVSWKIHQSLISPRFKDLFDLMYLVAHADFDATALQQMQQALVNECAVDKVDLRRLESFLRGDFASLFDESEYWDVHKEWDRWRHGKLQWTNSSASGIPGGAEITDVSKLPDDETSFFQNVSTALAKTGIHSGLMNQLPLPTRSTFFPGRVPVTLPSAQDTPGGIVESSEPQPGKFDEEADIDPAGTVQGSSGAAYSSDEDAAASDQPEPRPGLLTRIRRWFSRP